MPSIKGQLLDHTGQPLTSPKESLPAGISAVDLQRRFNMLLQERRMLRAKYDAAQTFTANENHWSNADNLDPHSVASLGVRRVLRSRSRYEIIENNPYLKGTVLTIVNDFIGSCPTLQVTDKRLSDARRKKIEDLFKEWAYVIGLRRKLWRMRMAKIVDGETFALFYANKNRRRKYPVQLDMYVIECDRISDQNTAFPNPDSGVAEIDGVRFDQYENPLAYFVLYQHPGGSSLSNFSLSKPDNGKWVDSADMVHWYRQDRGWLRGIPETAPSLPLCALLRRYTLATVRNAEVIADFTVLLETQNPASPTPWTTGPGGAQLLSDDPFDLFPLEMGMAMNLPLGYVAKQLETVPLGAQFDEFVGCLLREITRPLLAPYNIASGSSKDSNMASAVVDAAIYKGGQQAERHDCEHQVLDHCFYQWWLEASRVDGYLGDPLLLSDETFRRNPPQHRWRWDQIGIDHTDPQKVAEALKVMHDKRFITDHDIQEGRFNRSYDDWKAEVESEEEFRSELEPVNPEERQPPPSEDSEADSSPPKKKSRPAPKARKPARR